VYFLFFSFYFIFQGDPARAFMNATPEEMSRMDRFNSAWHGKRNQGQRLIEIAIDGAESDEAAVDSLRRYLRKFIVPLPQ
jgi:oligoribonuclease (3'-5' exoribonuclease)